MIQLKDDCAKLRVSCPLTGKQVWLQEVDIRLWPLYSKSYPHYFIEVYEGMASVEKPKKSK